MADPETAAAVRRHRMAQIAASGATIVATTDSGCRIRLRAGLTEAGLDLPVVDWTAIIGAATPSGDRPHAQIDCYGPPDRGTCACARDFARTGAGACPAISRRKPA
jgi:hypothetical protein